MYIKRQLNSISFGRASIALDANKNCLPACCTTGILRHTTGSYLNDICVVCIFVTRSINTINGIPNFGFSLLKHMIID